LLPATFASADPHTGAGVPQTGDQPQDVSKHLSRYRDFGHLEDHN
jgi:hypothetical protein